MEEGPDDTPTPTRSSVACELCRQRKRKCDRKLPVCFQCTSEPSRCQYPETNKRGIPVGYLSKLEARLSETEAALCHVLSYIGRQHGYDGLRSAPIPPWSEKGAYQNKQEKMKEWDQLPLKTTPDFLFWFGQRQPQSSRASSPSPFNPPADQNRSTYLQETSTLVGSTPTPDRFGHAPELAAMENSTPFPPWSDAGQTQAQLYLPSESLSNNVREPFTAGPPIGSEVHPTGEIHRALTVSPAGFDPTNLQPSPATEVRLSKAGSLAESNSSTYF